MPTALLLSYWLLSLFTFVLYALDKSKARRGEWRIKEKHLQLLALIGGWPGALIGQQTLRHKSQKISFRLVLALTIVVNCGVFVWLLSPKGGEFLSLFASLVY